MYEELLNNFLELEIVCWAAAKLYEVNLISNSKVAPTI